MLLKRYVIREGLRSTAAVLVLIVLAYVSSRFVQYLAEAAAGKLGIDLILELVGLKLVTSSVLMVPLCHYLGVYLALSRMGRDHELAAMASFGLGTPFLLRVIAPLALGAAALTGLLALVVAPWAEDRLAALELRAKLESDVTGISAGQFKEFSQGDQILYVERLSPDRHHMSDLFLHIRQGRNLGVLSSDAAELQLDRALGALFVVFRDGYRYIGVPGRRDYSITQYAKYGVRIDRNGEDRAATRMAAAPTASLWRLHDDHAQAELQWRIAMPLSALLLCALAAVWVRPTSDHGRYVGILSAVLAYFTYNNLLGIARGLMKRGELSTALGLWWVHASVVVVIAACVYYPQLQRQLARRLAALRGRRPRNRPSPTRGGALE